MAKEIQLTKGKVAIVDDEDFEYLNQWKWYAHKTNTLNFYAERSMRINGKKTFILMHRVIMNTDKHLVVDHINGNGLDNTKLNLRNCTNSENIRNRKISSNNTSGYKGFHYNIRDNMWRSTIRINNKRLHIGNFIDITDAAKAYNEAAIKFHGEFARLNEI